ncbi:MAG: DUF1501 domain-containing protein [Planctomycetes bacterium]|nr:DUF1501 domain-containing protein [Planctomycetota bacterium]
MTRTRSEKSRSLSRRHMLAQSGCGFAALALAGVCADAAKPLSPKVPHFPARAKRVIFLFMHGGPSHVDTFDYKPRLQKEDGGKLPFKANPLLDAKTLRLLGSPWKFRQYGESGTWVSDLFPRVARHVDDICMIHSMHTNGVSHGQAVSMLHTGTDSFVRPSLGAWVSYGLGSANRNLPGFVSITPPRGHGGPRNYGSAFLPAAHQATAIGHSGMKAKDARIAYLDTGGVTKNRQRVQLDLLQQMNRSHLARAKHDEQLEGVIESFELAFRMQTEAPLVMDISKESKPTLKMYGIGESATDNFGRECLLARRFAEAGVRFIQVSFKQNGWDQHSNLRQGHTNNAQAVDQPIAGLLADLKQRGLLDDTLVIFSGEFGRTPIVQGKNGRDHNPQGFTTWMAGGGVKGGFHYGATDDYGYYAVNNKVHMHDLHATFLRLLGIDHKRLTYRYAGRDFRLTDVYGNVVTEIIA